MLVAMVWDYLSDGFDSSESEGNNIEVNSGNVERQSMPEAACEDTTFCFLGEAVDRKENFGERDDVDTTNIYSYYRKYDITKLTNDLFLVESKKIYENSRYLSRLIRFSDGKQTAAITFYDYSFKNMVEVDDGMVFVGLNSLSYSSNLYPSSFGCKIVLLDQKLTPIKGKLYQYVDDGLEYTYVDTLYQTKKGVHAVVVNEGFDNDYSFVYDIDLDNRNRIVSSSKIRKGLL